MATVLIATVPCVLHSIYRFGWRSVAVLATTLVFAFLAEWVFVRQRNEPVTSAAFVTAILLGLSLPPTIPLWIAAVGAVVGIVFGKQVFGGFGRNLFNPALVGRAFIYVCFPLAMTGRWGTHLTEGVAGLARWSTQTIDAVTTATPLGAFKHGVTTEHIDLLFGNRTGSLGETAVVAIILGAIWLLYRRAADYRLMLGPVIGALGMGGILWLAGVKGVPDPLWNLMAGGILFVAVFMTTEPISGPRTVPGKWIGGILVGCLTMLIRAFGAFACGATFAVLLMNMFSPTIDYAVNAWKKRGAAL